MPVKQSWVCCLYKMIILTSRVFVLGRNDSVDGVFKHWISFSTQAQKNISSSDLQVGNLVIKRLSILKADIKKKIYAYERNLKDYQNTINKSRNGTQDAISSHEAHVLSRQQSVVGTSTFLFDPWLQERFLQKTLQGSVDQENIYQKNMTTLFENMSLFDAHIVEGLCLRSKNSHFM